jgi:hypothetical protein
MADTTQQPSTANIAAACAILAGVTGYMLGQAKSLGFFGGSPVSQPTKSEKETAEESENESSDEDDDSTPAEFPDHNEECKMVLVVRTDLGMTKGIAIPDTCRLAARYLTMKQARLAHNADTRHWPATSTSSDTHRTRRYYDAGNEWGKRRWHCKSRARRS